MCALFTALGVVLAVASCDRGDSGDSPALSPAEYADVYELVSARLTGVTEGAPTRAELIRECTEAKADVERRRPQLEGAADDELAKRGERWADALEAYYESCEDHPVDHPDRRAALERVNKAWGSVAARMTELGVEPAY